MKKFIFINILLCTIFSQSILAQEREEYNVYVIYYGDTLPVMQLNPVHVFAPRKFKNKKDQMRYTKLVRDVRIAYPYARLVASSIIETYEMMQTMPDEKMRQKHMEAVQKELIKAYKPKMKKMTKNQGKILVKLIDRQTNSSSYDIVKALVGSFKAGVYNVFAGLFGNNLKNRYDPDGEDREIENIVIQIEQGTVDIYAPQAIIC